MKINFRVTLVNLFLISSLLSDTIIFNDGQQLKGKLEKITEKHPYDLNTGAEQEVLFKVEKYNLNTVPKNLVINKTADNVFMFDVKSIYKIEDDYGSLIWSDVLQPSLALEQSPKALEQSPKALNINELELTSTDIILSNGNDMVNIPISGEMDLILYKPVSLTPLNVVEGVIVGALGGMLIAGPIGAFMGGGLVAYGYQELGTTSILKAKYKGIGTDTVSQKNYILTNKGAVELTNISKIKYIESYESKALEGFLVGTGTLLIPGGLLLLIGEKAMGPDGIGFVFAGAGLILFSPINGMMKALENWRIPKKKYFEINDNAWKIDKSLMLSNNKSVEQN